MRPVRNFIIVSALLFCLAAAFPVRAADSYFSVVGCPDDPAIPCETTGDGVNTNIPLTDEATIMAQTANQLLGPQNFTMSWFGILKPLGNYLIGKDKLKTYANQVQTASDNELNPAQLQSAEQHDTTSKSASMTSRLCVYDPTSGNVIGDMLSTTTITSNPQEWIPEHVESAQRISSFTTNYVQESQDFRKQNITIRQDAALPCKSHWTGETKTQNADGFQNQNIYGSGSTPLWVNFIYNVTAGIIRLIHLGDGSTASQAGVQVGAEIVGTEQHPYTGHDSALTAGCATKGDLDAVSYATAEQKQKLCDAGGYVNSMYRPDSIAIDYTHQLNASEPNQQWEQTVTGGQPIENNTHAYAARIEGAGDYMNCTLMPADYQSAALPNGECNTNWVSGGVSGGGWNCDTSVPEQSVPGLNSAAGQSYADRVYGACTSGKQNAWEQCKNDVIASAKNACVDPLFALAIWLHESGASNYICGEQLSGGKVQDFGINVSSIAENFSAQLDRFLLLPSYYASRCPKTLRDFVSLFWFGDACYNQESASNKGRIDGYIGELQLIYSTIAPGVPLPTWPAGC